MDSTILTSLIAAGSACIGALIPCLFSFLGKQKEYKNNQKAKMDELRRVEYKIYIEALQTMINNGTRDNFLPFQTCTNRLLLFASPDVSNKVNRFYLETVNRTLDNNPLTKEEVDEYETRIVNAMREDLGIAGELLDKVSLVRASF